MQDKVKPTLVALMSLSDIVIDRCVTRGVIFVCMFGPPSFSGDITVKLCPTMGC